MHKASTFLQSCSSLLAGAINIVQGWDFSTVFCGTDVIVSDSIEMAGMQMSHQSSWTCSRNITS